MKTLFWDSINPATGTPYTWDDPNIFWADPAFILEPGDPGYTPPEPPLPQPKPKPKTKPMKRQLYYPTSTAEQIIWLENFRNKIAGHAASLGVTPAACAAAIADARWVIYVIGSWLPAVRQWQLSCTDAAAEAQSPDGPGTMVLPVFVPPGLPAAVAPDPAVVPVKVGALDRIFALVQVIKKAANFTETNGTDLGIIGSEATGPDLNTIAPTISVQVTASGVKITWGWNGWGAWLDMCELQVDRGTGWGPLAFDTTPNYTDNTPPPATLTKWKYRAIYHAGDVRVGVWSAEVSVTIGG